MKLRGGGANTSPLDPPGHGVAIAAPDDAARKDAAEAICPTPTDESLAAEPAAPQADPTPTTGDGLLTALTSIERAVPSVEIISLMAVVAALWWGQALWIPLVLSLLVSYALEPAISRMVAWHLPRPLAVPVLLTVVIASTAAGGYALRGEAEAFVNRLPGAVHTLAEAIHNVTRAAPGTLSRVQQAAEELETAAGEATQSHAPGPASVRIEQPTFQWNEWLWQGSRNTLEFAGQGFAVLCLVYCLLASGDMYKRKLVRIVPTLTRKKMTVNILAEIDRQIERFLLARLFISAAVAVMVWAAFRAVGVQQAGVWGLLAGVLFAIPVVGPVVIVTAAALAGFVQFGSIGMAVLLASVCTVIGVFEGNVLTPWLMSRVGEMNPVAVFISLLFWGWIWGVWGLLLAIPMTAAIKAVCERIEDFQGFAELLRS